EFPGVRFVAPETPAPEAASEPPIVTPLPVRPWRRWAAAAVVLLALGGVGGPAAWYGRDYYQTQRTADAKHAALAQARAQLNDLENKQRQVPQERQRRKEQIAEDLRAKQLKVKVTGPASVPTGAPANYQIETFNLHDQPTTATVTAQVMDGTQPV